MQWFWIEPVDTLSFRGNRLFGDAGSFGESMMPPWPSVFAGAFRAAILQWDKGFDLQAWRNGEIDHPVVGSWRDGVFTPGSLHMGPIFIGRKVDDGQLETCHFPPQDVLLTKQPQHQQPAATRLVPRELNHSGLNGRFTTEKLPVLAQAQRAKPQNGWLIRQSGFERYLHGQVPDSDQFIRQEWLWTMEIRTGIGLDGQTRSAEEGKLFTVQLVTFRPNVGFVVGIEGAEDALPDTGLLRLGGDGHAARFSRLNNFSPPQLSDSDLAAADRLRLVTLAPAVLNGGWKPKAADGLVCAAVQRAEVISGWNLKGWAPKPARRTVSAGSVYWFEGIEPQALKQQWQSALIRADEGFGQYVLAIG